MIPSIKNKPAIWLWLLLLVSLPLSAGLTAEYINSISTGLNQPTDTAISPNGDIYSLNGVLGNVIVFSSNGKQKFSFSRPGSSDSALNLPMAITIYNKQVFIADTGNARISIFTLQGKFIRYIKLKMAHPAIGAVASTATSPSHKTAAPVSLLIIDNKIIWSDRNNHQLCVTDIKEGKTLKCWGSKGEKDSQFNYPYQLAADSQGYIFAVDVLNARVQAFTPAGKHFMNTGRFGVNSMGALFRPNGLALYKNNFLLVSDAYLATVSIYKNGRALGLLTDNNNEHLKFRSATSLTLHDNKLYITDTLDSRIEIYKLNDTDTSRITKTKKNNSNTKPQPGSSQKNCISCHISWADNYSTENEDESEVTPVAHQAMCYSCHHGVVIDSRKDIGHKQQHPDIHHKRDDKNLIKKNKDKDSIAKHFPLISKQTKQNNSLYCGSCHTPHKLNSDKQHNLNSEHNNSWMRETNNRGEICQQCHESKLDDVQHSKRISKGINHPVGISLTKADIKQSKSDSSKNKLFAKDKNLHKGLPDALKNSGAFLNQKKQMICQSCHKVHGSDEQQLTAVRTSGAEICVSCHQRHETKDIESARKKGVHPVNIKLEEPVKINQKEVTHVDCLTCHSTHNGKVGSALLIKDDQNGELCNACHKDYNKLVNSDHDLRLSAEKSKNRFNQTPEHTGACGSCHKMHEAENNKFSLDATKKRLYLGKEEPLPRDQMCLNCHHKDGAANKSQIKYFSHPTKELILRSDKRKMPLLDRHNEINEFGEIGCITCHNPHRWSVHKDIEEQAVKSNKDKSGNILSSFLRNKEVQDSFCKDCHGIETKIKYKYYHLESSR